MPTLTRDQLDQAAYAAALADRQARTLARLAWLRRALLWAVLACCIVGAAAAWLRFWMGSPLIALILAALGPVLAWLAAGSLVSRWQRKANP